MKKFLIGLSSIVIVIALGFGLQIVNNKLDYWHKKIDEDTKYENLKQVEDTCRAMISNYEADKLVYEQYKNSTKDDELQWSNQAKIRANKTVAQYNEYILKNKYLWKDNVPSDIRMELYYLY